MKYKFIIIAILIFLKIIGIASHAKAGYFSYGLCDYSNDYGFGYDNNGLNEFGQKSIGRIIEESQCNEKQRKRINEFMKEKKIF
tara:strand:+ start:268 stop:519 length:252 start_codon:yes stop_codon:yes gene_type:complete